MFESMTIEQFQEIVHQTVETLPEEFKKYLDNVDIQVETWPTPQDLQAIRAHPGTILFGLYRGIPQTKRGLNYTGALPDSIVIFAGPIISMSKNLPEAKEQIRKTVLHEIGHYFGMTEEDIRKAEY